MPSFHIVSRLEDISLSKEFIDASKFDSKDRCVKRDGTYLQEKDFDAPHFKLISKKVRSYSYYERVLRIIKACALILKSFGKNYQYAAVKKLLFKTYETKRFAIKADLDSSLHIPEDALDGVKNAMRELLTNQSHPDIEYYHSNPVHAIFSLKTHPDLVFKFDRDPDHVVTTMRQRYFKMKKAHTLISSHNLSSLVVPPSKLINLCLFDCEIPLLVEKKLSFNDDVFYQNQLARHLDSKLSLAIQELALFILKTGYSDVCLRNNPILEGAAMMQKPTLGLIDLEYDHDATCGLFGCDHQNAEGLFRAMTVNQASGLKSFLEGVGFFSDTHLFKGRSLLKSEKEHELKQAMARAHELDQFYLGLETFYRDHNVTDLKAPINEGLLPCFSCDTFDAGFHHEALQIIASLNSQTVAAPSALFARYCMLNIPQDKTGWQIKGALKYLKAHGVIFSYERYGTQKNDPILVWF